MTIEAYIRTAAAERQALLTTLHQIIVENDSTVMPVIKPMMGSDMILYEQRSYMKYGLASTIKYMSFHCLPIYMDAGLHAKYLALLPLAKFQKGCINFAAADELPADVFKALIAECAAIDIAEVLENRKKKPSK